MPLSIHKLTAIGLLLVSLCAGCAAPQQRQAIPRVATYISPAMAQNPPDRIVIVPFASPAGEPEAGRMATAALAMAIQGTLCCDTVLPAEGDERLAAESVLWQSGRVDVESLIVAQKAYLADAFLFGTVTQYKPYDPPVMGLKLRMLSARTGDDIWAAEALFNAREQDVRVLTERYFQNSGFKDRLYGPELIRMSPKLFADFVAAQVVRPLGEQLQRTRNLVAADAAH
jgi:hypothetical protein